MARVERQSDYVLRTVEERGVRLIRLWFTDVLGQLKSFAISPAELEGAFDEGMRFDGSAIDGFSRVQESDVLARPDPNSFELLPWADSYGTSARMFCDITNIDGTPFEGDPRQVLRRNLDRAHERGFSFYAAPRDGVLLLRGRRRVAPPRPLDHASYFDLTTADVASDLRQRTIHTLGPWAPVEYSFHEDAPSQHEIDLRYTDALAMADNVMTFRLVVREMALEAGRARHVHAQADGRMCRAPACTPTCRSTRATPTPSPTPATRTACRRSGRGFIAGLLHHAAEITAVTNQLGQLLQAARRRLRGAGLRVAGPATTAPSSSTCRRSRRARPTRPASSSARPTRRATRTSRSRVVLAAGLKGVEEGYELPPETSANLYAAHRRGAAGRGHRRCCPGRWPRPSTRWSAPSSWPRRSASTSSSGSSATSAPSGRTTRPRSPQFELDRYLPRL